MRTRRGAYDVERVVAVGDPVAQGLVHRVLQRRASLGDGVHRRAEHAHASDVRRLAVHVYRAHVYLAGHSEERGDCRGRDAVHSRARLRDESALAHALREQGLSDGVVHLVRAGVVEVLSLQDYRRAAELFGEAAADGDRRLASDVVVQQLRELALEGGIVLRREVRGLELLERSHQCFGDVLSAVLSVVSVFHCLAFSVV